MRLALTLMLLLPLWFVNAQENIPMLGKNDFKTIRTIGQQTFNDSSLWGYINGGADIYLEYGFDKLLTDTYIIDGYMIRVEAFLMKDEAAAFGIFSASHHNCKPGEAICKYYCKNNQQVQFTAGRLYYNITSIKLNPGSTEACESVALVLCRKTKANDYIPSSLLSTGIFEQKAKDMKLFRGTLGFQNAFPDWQEKFEDFKKPEIVLVPFDFPEGTFTASVLQFSSEPELERFIKSQKLQPAKKKHYISEVEKCRRYLIKTGKASAYFQESWGRSEAIDKAWNAALDQVIGSLNNQ